MPEPVFLAAHPGTSGEPRRSLLLAGGGMRVAYQAGVMRALREAGLRFFHADGASGGTINLAMLFSGLSPEEMCRRWHTLRVRDFVSFLPPAKYLKAHSLKAMGDAGGLRDRVFPHLGIDMSAVRTAEGMEGTFNVCNFTRKTNEVVSHREMDLDLLVAAVSLPILLPPVEKYGALYLDSAWIKDTNVWEAVRRGAEEIWLVWCIGNSAEYRGGAFNQYVHTIELSANGALFEEFERVRELNERITRGDSPYGQSQPVRLHVIKPEHPLPLDPEFYFNRVDAGTLISRGYADACAYLKTRTDAGLAFTPETTAMTDRNPGLTFREKMAGPFSLGETDPARGADKGKATPLALHATVTIDDMQAFRADPEHRGSLAGHVEFAPFGPPIPASRGVFQLFAPSAEDPRMKKMVYEVAFRHDGREYYLAGHKQVKDGPGFDLWKDTTTLLTTLHEGPDAGGPVVGAGILRLGMGDLFKLASTVSPQGARGIGQRVSTIFRFGWFFLLNLWEQYVKSKFFRRGR
jgi:predicted acylesterase/phospholipase RssA